MNDTISALLQAVFDLSPGVRYAAVLHQGALRLSERAGIQGASAPESDRYEELLVNPTLLTLLTQRGNIDCGGLRFVIIRYGNFFQVVRPLPQGHLSVSVEPGEDPLAIAESLDSLAAGAFPSPGVLPRMY